MTDIEKGKVYDFAEYLLFPHRCFAEIASLMPSDDTCPNPQIANMGAVLEALNENAERKLEAFISEYLGVNCNERK